jgi:hypothetical protein
MSATAGGEDRGIPRELGEAAFFQRFFQAAFLLPTNMPSSIQFGPPTLTSCVMVGDPDRDVLVARPLIER